MGAQRAWTQRLPAWGRRASTARGRAPRRTPGAGRRARSDPQRTMPGARASIPQATEPGSRSERRARRCAKPAFGVDRTIDVRSVAEPRARAIVTDDAEPLRELGEKPRVVGLLSLELEVAHHFGGKTRSGPVPSSTNAMRWPLGLTQKRTRTMVPSLAWSMSVMVSGFADRIQRWRERARARHRRCSAARGRRPHAPGDVGWQARSQPPRDHRPREERSAQRVPVRD
jgi:hypothetical protein